MIDYLHPDVPPGLPRVRMPMVDATPDNLRGYGNIVADPTQQQIEIVRWPATGRRPIDEDSGNEGGISSGIFTSWWEGDILYGRNEAVDGHYVLGYATEPSSADAAHARPPDRVLMWHANYHPDGGQSFFPLDRRPFVVPLALPGDDVRPEHFIAFRFDGTQGLYIHPNVWHDGVFPFSGSQRFDDRQGAVHARVSVLFAPEFHRLPEIAL